MCATALGAWNGCGGESAASTDITIRVYPDGVPSFIGETRNAPLVAFNPNGIVASGPRAGHGERPGGAEWIELTGTDGVYHATATGSRYIVAVGCNMFEPQWLLGGLYLYYQTIDDATDLAVWGCPGEQETVPVSVELDGVPSDAVTEVWLGSTAMFTLDSRPVQSESPKGIVDVLATTHRTDPTTRLETLIRGYRAPDPIEISGPYSLKLDYGALALPFETYALSVTGFDPGDGASVLSTYATPHSRRQWPLVSEGAEIFSSESETTYATLDRSMRQPDDTANLRVHTRTFSDDLLFDRYVRVAMKDPVAQSVALPPKLIVEAPSFDSAANRVATVRLPNTPAMLNMVDYTVSVATVIQGAADEPYTHRWVLFVQSGWADGESSIVVTTPDLSGLRGWTTDMALQAGGHVEWWIRREDRTMPRDTLPVDGRKILHSEVRGLATR